MLFGALEVFRFFFFCHIMIFGALEVFRYVFASAI